MKKLLLIIFSFCITSASAQLNNEFIDFDGPVSNSISVPSASLWKVGTPSKTVFDSAFSVPKAIVTDTLNSYPVNANSYFDLVIRSINSFSGMEPVFFSFKHRFETDTLKDGGTISYSFDGGLTWSPITMNGMFYSYPVNGTGPNAYDPVHGFTGDSKGWYNSNGTFFQLCDPNFQLVDSVVIRFTFKSDSINTNKDGWMIDDLMWQFGICPGVNESRQEMITVTNSAETLSISSAESSIATLLINDSYGKTVRSYKDLNGKLELNITDLAKGVYYVVIPHKDGPIVKRFLR
jgi:hypothetical protein